MTEEFLHHIWKLKLFNKLSLHTTSGEVIEVIKPGAHNTDAGPDFFNAQIRIAETVWAGNVEVHLNASDWKKHNHHHDKAYDNIILHVVYNADCPIYRASGEQIPLLELKDKIDKKIYDNYLNFKTSKDWIPCEKQLNGASSLVVNNMLDKLVLERLQRKLASIINSLQQNNNNWEETFYGHLARNFGFKVNAQPFEMLAKSMPHTVLGKHKDNLFQIESMLFGQAGLLNSQYDDDYVRKLQNEYVFLKNKFKLTSIEEHLWKFLRLRPVNFPTVRIAQFAGLIHRSSSLFSKIIETEDIDALKFLLTVDVSEYWKTHYVFDKPSKYKNKQLGEEALNNILINTVVPFLFVYGKQKNDEKFVDRALVLLEHIAGEENKIITCWKGLGMPVKTAYFTQALLQLKNEYCDNKKCLQCAIGSELIKKS